MKNQHPEHVIGIPVSSSAYPVEGSGKGYFLEPPTRHQTPSPPDQGDSVTDRMNKLGKKADSFVNGVREHVRLAPNISETVKGKLSLGARILQVGGVEKIFKRLFRVREGEKLLKASQCYLSTTVGPIAGLLFISTDKIAFCSERAIKFSSANGELVRIHYKVLIPLRKIKIANQSENTKKPSQKYIEIVTTDNFEFWFMGFLNYQKAFKYLQQALSQA